MTNHKQNMSDKILLREKQNFFRNQGGAVKIFKIFNNFDVLL